MPILIHRPQTIRVRLRPKLSDSRARLPDPGTGKREDNTQPGGRRQRQAGDVIKIRGQYNVNAHIDDLRQQGIARRQRNIAVAQGA